MRKLTLALCILWFALIAVAQKTVHVGGYTRKDGTVVAPYDRKAPDGAESGSSATGSSSSSGSASGSTTQAASEDKAIDRDPNGKIKRSEAAKREFREDHPCPHTNRIDGACEGFVIDHIKPLACGGADAPSNMQWQTVEAAKEKDKWEREGCPAKQHATVASGKF